jgi:hypothetical protein
MTDDIQEQLLTEKTTVKPTDFIRMVSDPITLPDSTVIQKSKFVDNLFGDVISPVVNGAVNDWAPTGLATAHFIRIFPSGPASISGITTGTIGRVLILFNVASSLVNLLDESTLSVASNRISVQGTGNDYILQPDSGVMLAYDSTTSRWRVIGAISGTVDGWNPLGSFFTFVSVDGATTVVTTAADVTTKVQKGTRLRYAQNQALTAYWNLDASSASQVGSFPGTDTAVTYTAGKFGNAATFDGATSKIVITDNVLLKPTSDFTIGMWIKTASTGADKTIYQSYSQNTAIAGLVMRVDSTNVIVVLVGKNTGTTDGVDYTLLRGVTNVTDNNWHYVVYTFKNNYAQIYVDGVLDAASYSLTPVYAATNYVRIGMRSNAGSDLSPFNGQIDDLFIINGYALDEQTIKAKYAAQTAQGTGNLSITKYGIITNVSAYSGGVTTLTFWGGTDYSSVNSSFGTPYYSIAKVPVGFNADSNKWSVLLTDAVNRTQSAPATNTWYNMGALNFTLPIGQWLISYKAKIYEEFSSAVVVYPYFTLSTANNSESDPEFTCGAGIYAGGGPPASVSLPISMSKILTLSTKTTYYVNMMVAAGGAGYVIYLMDGQSKLIIRAISTFL